MLSMRIGISFTELVEALVEVANEGLDLVESAGGFIYSIVMNIFGFFEFITKIMFFFIKNPMLLTMTVFTMILIMSMKANDIVEWMGLMAHNTKEVVMFFVSVLSMIANLGISILRFIRELIPFV